MHAVYTAGLAGRETAAAACRQRTSAQRRVSVKQVLCFGFKEHVTTSWFSSCENSCVMFKNNKKRDKKLIGRLVSSPTFSTLTRDIDIAILSVRSSVRYVPVFYGNGLTFCHTTFTAR